MLYLIVLHDFQAETDDEISVNAGETVCLVSKEDDGWCVVEHNGKQGLFPPSFLDFDGAIEGEEEKEEEGEEEKNQIDNISMLEEDQPFTETIQTEESGEAALSEEEKEELESEEEEEEIHTETPEERAVRKEEQRKRHRKNVINEIRVTESDYVKDIEIIANVFNKPLAEEGIIAPSDITSLFCNIAVLLNVNERLLSELASNDDDETISIGKIFIGMADFFKMYTAYCANQPKAMEVLDRLGKISSFKAFTDKCMLDPECRGLTLFSFLIKPIQRICKYPLLLRDLLKVTPEDHFDYDNLVAAMGKIEEVVAYVNEKKRLAENLQKIIDVQNQIESNEDLNLVSPSRRFVREGVFQVCEPKSKATSRKIYLFNDLVVITRPKKNNHGKDQFKYQLSLNDAKIIDVADTEEVRFACEIRPKGNDDNRLAYVIIFPNVEDKYLWVKEIKSLVKEFQRRQYQERQRLLAKAEKAPLEKIETPEAPVEIVTPDKSKRASKSRREPKNINGGTSLAPGPSRANSARNSTVSSVISSPFSWRKSSKKDVSVEKKPTGKPVGKGISRRQQKQMAAPKPPPPSKRVSLAQSCPATNGSIKVPEMKASPMKNMDFAAQLNATLKSRHN